MLKASTIILLNLSNFRFSIYILGPILWALFISPQSFASQDLEELANDPQWLNLYRYTSTGMDNDSTVTNNSWFFHPQGRSNPLAELKEAIKVLSTSEDKRCLFPARSLFLKRHGHLKEGNDSCPKYEYFARKLQLENVWIVFASYYVNNPSSAFGHTLFKIEGKSNQQNDYLEYGANFAAQTTTANPLAYAILGLTGGFKGNYGLLPYFVKIQEYNDSESRDLWEYKLDFNTEEKDMFLAHLWEMDQAQYDYYYLTENCSYHLLTFLDAIRPTLGFKEKLPYFILPSETLSILNQKEGFVSEIRKRPSQFNIVQSRFENLSNEAQEYWNDTELFIPKKEFSQEEKSDYLDFSIDYLDLKYQKELHKEVEQKGGKYTTLKRKIQMARSQLTSPTQKIKINKEDSPDQIHAPRIISTGYALRSYEKIGQQDKSLHKNYLLGYRFSFHELLDHPAGAPTWSELIMGKILARYDETDDKLYLDQFTLFRTHANQQKILSPIDLSWLVEMGARDHLFSAHHDFGPYVKTHIGYNWQVKSHLLRFLIPFELDYSSTNSYIKSPLKALVTPRMSYYALVTDNFRLNLDLGMMWRSYQKEDWEGFGELSFQLDLFKDIAIETKAFLQKENYQSEAQLKYYF